MRGSKPSAISTDGALTTVPDPFEWLTDEAKEEWQRVAPILVKRRTLAETDLMLFAIYCMHVATVVTCQRTISKGELFVKSERSAPRPHPAHKVMSDAMTKVRQCAAELGLTPVGRSRLPRRKGDDDGFAGVDI